MKRDLAREMYKAFRKGPKRFRKNETEVRSKNEDPTQIGEVLSELVAQRDWARDLAEGNIFTEWEKVVGNEIAAHSKPITLVEGRLTIQATSTAWSTQLNLIKTDLLNTISNTAPGALVEELNILGPHAPTWKKGLRSIRGGRGPRDTYN